MPLGLAAASVIVFESADRSEGSEVGGVREPPVEFTELSASLFGTSISALDPLGKVWVCSCDAGGLLSLTFLEDEIRRRSFRKDGIMLHYQNKALNRFRLLLQLFSAVAGADVTTRSAREVLCVGDGDNSVDDVSLNECEWYEDHANEDIAQRWEPFARR